MDVESDVKDLKKEVYGNGREGLRYMVGIILTRVLSIEKSRETLVYWLLCAIFLAALGQGAVAILVGAWILDKMGS